VPAGLTALAGLGSNPGVEGGFLARLGLRLNSRTGTEGLPVSSLNWDRPLHSGIIVAETVMSTGGQTTDSVRPYGPRRSM